MVTDSSVKKPLRSILVYDSSTRSWLATLAETWDFRETIGLLVYQRLAIRYRRSILGFMWAFLNPLIQITVIAVVFGLIFHETTNNLRDDITANFAYVATGLLPWQFFQGQVSGLSSVFINAESMIKKVYLPMLIFPVSQIVAGMLDLCFALLAMCLLFVVLGNEIKPTTPLVLPGILLLAVFTLGITLFVSVTNVYFRDFGFIVGVMLQLWFYATPILWPWNKIPQQFAWIFKANPFWNFLLFFRAVLQDGTVPSPDIWLKCVLWATAAFVFGFAIYRGVERKMIFRL